MNRIDALRPNCLGGKAVERTPVSFAGRVGMVHIAKGAVEARAAIVLIPPIGSDRIKTYRPMFQWADLLANHGYIVLRYDPMGEGDSLLIPQHEDAAVHWQSDVAKAADFLRCYSGNIPLVLCGLRIGATFAAAATDQLRPDALVLWDPLPSGRHWLREVRFARAMTKVSATEKGAEIFGLSLSAASVATLERIDLSPPRSCSPPILLASPSALGTLKSKLGPEVETVRFSGYAKLFKESHVNEPPMQLFEETLNWLDTRFAPLGISLDARPVAEPLRGSGWREERVEFGGGLQGVLCIPTRGTANNAVLFCNTGANPRCSNGNTVTYASRELARKGLITLRFDFSGIGESAQRTDRPIHIYETERRAEFAAAMCLLKQYSIKDVTVVGISSGGYQAIWAAVEGVEIKQVIAVNPRLVWNKGDELEEGGLVASMRATYLAAPPKMRGLISKHGSLPWLRKLLLAPRHLVRLYRWICPAKAVYGAYAQLERALRRGVKIHFVYGNDDPLVPELDNFGLRGRWLKNQLGFTVSFFSDIDHSVSLRLSQARFVSELFRQLDVRSAGVLDSSTPIDEASLDLSAFGFVARIGTVGARRSA